MLDTPRDILIEEIGRSFNAGRFSDIVKVISQEDIRANVIGALADRFGIPNRGDVSDRAFAATLMGCRLKEDSLGGKEQRDEARGFLVGLVVEATMLAQGIEDDRPAAEDPFDGQEGVLVSGQGAEPESGKINPVAQVLPFAAPPKATPPAPARPASVPLTLVSGGEITIPLFNDGQPPRPHPPENLIALLQPGPGPNAMGGALSRWLSAIPTGPDAFAIGCGRLDAIGSDRLADIEAELFSAPRIILERYGQHTHQQASQPMFNGAHPGDIMDAVNFAWTDRVSGEETDAAVEQFRAAMVETITEFWPDRAAGLQHQGAVLRIGSALRRTIAVLAAVERDWLEELEGDTGGDRQIVLGNFRPTGAMEPGMLFRRAAFLTYGLGYQTNDAFAEAVMDLRYAQLCRVMSLDGWAPENAKFDSAFIEDCSRTLDAYRIRDEEPEPAF